MLLLYSKKYIFKCDIKLIFDSNECLKHLMLLLIDKTAENLNLTITNCSRLKLGKKKEEGNALKINLFSKGLKTTCFCTAGPNTLVTMKS